MSTVWEKKDEEKREYTNHARTCSFTVITSCLGRLQTTVAVLVEKIGNYSFKINIMHNSYVITVVSLLLPNKGLYGVIAFVMWTILGVLIPCAADCYIISKMSVLSRIMLEKRVK